MTTKNGHHSVWHFAKAYDGYYAFGGCHKPLTKRFKTLVELRDYYRLHLSWGYTTYEQAQQLELAIA